MATAPQAQEIRELAFKLWQEAGSPEGREDEFWHSANDQLTKERGDIDVDAAVEQTFPASDPANHM